MDDRYEPQQIEAKWQRVWEDERAFHTPNPPPGRGPTSATGTSWRCCRTRPAPCTWGTSSTTRWATSSRTTAAATAGRSCARWAGTRSGCPRRTPRSGGRPPARDHRAQHRDDRAQMKRLGWAIDWEREVAAHQPTFYRWTQWLFLKFFERGLAYRKEAPVNWCPNDRPCRERVRRRRPLRPVRRRGRAAEHDAVVLQDHRVRRRAARVRAARRRLVARATKTIQRNWIGRSEGAEILFRVEELDEDVPVFTTRPDTLFGATFFVVAPEHPLVERASASDEVREYAGTPARGAWRSARRRARRPASSPASTRQSRQRRAPADLGRRLRADGVRHRRDHGGARARRARLRVRRGVRPADRPTVIDEDGVLVDSGRVRRSAGRRGEARDRRVAARAGTRQAASPTGCATGASRGSATGAARSRSSTATSAAWSRCRRTSCRCCSLTSRTTCRRGSRRSPPTRNGCACRARAAAGRRGARPTRWTRSSTRRGTSCATSTRDNDQAPFDRAIVDYWLPVVQYIGGIDHATGHLLYSRFFVKALNDMGMVGFREPFARLFHQGWVQLGGTKMSKSKGTSSARRRWSSATAPTPCGCTSSSWGPPTRTRSGPRRDRGHRRVPAPAVARRARGRRAARRARATATGRWRARRTRRSRR